jgi:lipid-A-disaccharide synthase
VDRAISGEKRILLVTGEASGDLHAARLVQALRPFGPVRVRGIAGPALRAAGVESILPAEELAMVGFSEVLAKLPRILAARGKLLHEWRSFAPHAVLLVDYPGFNLRIGPALKSRGARIFYYIAPQVWAWHPERAQEMARWVDRLAVVFPFEEPIFRQAGVPATFVGHPLLDELAPEIDEAGFRAELGIDGARPVLGLLPGSRPQELARHLEPLADAARELRRDRPQLVCVLALAPGLELSASQAAALEGVRVVRGRTRATQAFSTACAVASGTATLETALFGTPLVILYRTGFLNYAIARRLVTLPRIGLPNIVAGREVAPERIQAAASGPELARVLGPWLDDPVARADARRELAVVRQQLGGPGASARAAALLWELAA